MNYVPFAKNSSGKRDGILKKILYFCPIRYLLLSLILTLAWVSVLGVHFAVVSDQNTSYKILLGLLNCHKTFQKIIYLSVTSYVMLFFSLPSSMSLETREC